jgi:hypothetical protein
MREFERSLFGAASSESFQSFHYPFLQIFRRQPLKKKLSVQNVPLGRRCDLGPAPLLPVSSGNSSQDQKINKIQMEGRAKTPSIDQSWQRSVKRNRIICGHVSLEI